MPKVFEWFVSQDSRARQLILSWDVSSGALDQPAVHMLRKTRDTQLVCDFLRVAGRQDAAQAYRAFEERLPKGWFACYSGVFPQRTVPFLRVECIPNGKLQKLYANDQSLLAEHLAQVGLAELGETLLARCQILAASPFKLEFQFDVTPEGAAGSTFSASVRFEALVKGLTQGTFNPQGEAGELMRQLEEWGLADDRWRQLTGTTFSKRLKGAGESCLLWCYPAFVKLKWRDGVPVDAKTYLVASVTE